MKLIKTLTILTGLLIIADFIFAHYFIPQFNEMYKSFDVSEIPLITKIIVNTYKYWFLLLIIPIGIYLYIKDTKIQKEIEIFLLSLLIILTIILAVLVPLIIWSIYLPIFELADNIK